MRVSEAMQRWQGMSRAGSQSARLLFESGDYRGCANRTSYAAYHAATAVCVAHGDAFANGWNNPSHEQLPELIQNNGSLSIGDRRQIVRLLRALRLEREVADYRPGRTMELANARDCLISMQALLRILEISDE